MGFRHCGIVELLANTSLETKSSRDVNEYAETFAMRGPLEFEQDEFGPNPIGSNPTCRAQLAIAPYVPGQGR